MYVVYVHMLYNSCISSCNLFDAKPELVDFVVSSFVFDVVHEICDSFPCLNGGECKNEENSYTCMCKGRITGTNCESKFCVGDVSYTIFSNDI